MQSYWERAKALQAVGLEGQAMSQANVEIARRALDAFNRRDLSAQQSSHASLGLARQTSAQTGNEARLRPATDLSRTVVRKVCRVEQENQGGT
jgi:hypothetical protein